MLFSCTKHEIQKLFLGLRISHQVVLLFKDSKGGTEEPVKLPHSHSNHPPIQEVGKNWIVWHQVVRVKEKGFRLHGRCSVLTERCDARERTHCAGGDDFYESTTFCVRHEICSNRYISTITYHNPIRHACQVSCTPRTRPMKRSLGELLGHRIVFIYDSMH